MFEQYRTATPSLSRSVAALYALGAVLKCADPSRVAQHGADAARGLGFVVESLATDVECAVRESLDAGAG